MTDYRRTNKKSSSETPLDERVADHFRSVSLPLHDTQGLMRHILDCLGALKARMDEHDAPLHPHLVQIFGDSVRCIVDHITGFEPIDGESAVKFLLDTFPDDAKRGDGRQWLPVHWAAAIHSTDTPIMDAVMHERPAQLVKGHLHYDEQEALTHIAQQQHSLTAQDASPNTYKGLTPLHLICSLRHPRNDNIKHMIEMNPEALRCGDHRGWLPIHWCAFNNRHIETMQLLLKAYPDGCYEVNKKGKLPFQLAAYNRYTFMLDILYQENPEFIDGLDYNGNTPLHDAAKSLNHEGIRKLLSYKPELNRIRNFKEDLPIHKVFSFLPNAAVSKLAEGGDGEQDRDADDIVRQLPPTRLFHRQLETVKALLSVNPEIAALPDRNESLPLHLAVFHNSPYEVVEYIYNIYPSAALMKDNDHKLPIHYVNNAAVKKLLMKSSPPLIKAGIKDSFARFVM